MIFNGFLLASKKEALLKQKVAELSRQGKKVKIAAILFTEDEGSKLYSKLKQEAAQRVGIGYQLSYFSLIDPLEDILDEIKKLNFNPEVTGIIIQKPWRKTWLRIVKGADNLEYFTHDEILDLKIEFDQWWQKLVGFINLSKDVDGLHPETLQAIKNNRWKKEKKVLPATCRSVLEIINSANLRPKKTVIIGKSDLLGKPLFYELSNTRCEVEMIGSRELKERIEQKKFLYDADLVVSATGRKKLITGEMIKDGVAIIDVGEPKGDVDFESVKEKANFITPVPGGVGPMTVVSLLENGVRLIE